MAGVYPVHNNGFEVATDGRAGLTLATIKDLETFSPSIDSNTEDWTPMDQEGWARRAVTGKGLTFSFTGKRNYGDPGNDYIAGLLLETGQGVESVFKWTMPSGATLEMDCVINLTQPGGGDSTNIDTLEFEILSDGKPTFTPAV
ncbi:MAG: phage tail tube protein [Sphaerochaetaceae bacterium]